MSHETVNVYILKNGRLFKRGFELDKVHELYRLGLEASNTGQTIQVDLKDGQGEIVLVHEHGEVYDAESITVPIGSAPIDNFN